jgi:hypothetical protein
MLYGCGVSHPLCGDVDADHHSTDVKHHKYKLEGCFFVCKALSVLRPYSIDSGMIGGIRIVRGN